MKKIICFQLLLLIVSINAITEAQKVSKWGIKIGGSLSNSAISVKDFSPSINIGSQIGFFLGIINNYSLSKSFELQTELMYTNEGIKPRIGKDLISNYLKLSESDNEDISGYPNKDLSVSLCKSYIKLPILLKYKTTEGLSIMTGPYIAYRAGLSLNTNNTISDLFESHKIPVKAFTTLAENVIKDNTKKLDFGICLGTEYSLKNIFFDIRYNYSLINSIKKKIDLSSIGTEDILDSENDINTIINTINPQIKHHSVEIGIGYRF
jgi:opacity protein-like surface antigen